MVASQSRATLCVSDTFAAFSCGGNRGIGFEVCRQLAQQGLSVVLGAELRGSGILVNAACPGWVATEMGGSGGRPVAEGAAGIVWAATLPDDGPTAGFFRDKQPLAW